MDRWRAGTGYLSVPDSGAGPGVLVLHAWWGLTDVVREVCDRLAEAGFVALAPDLYGGDRAMEVADAKQLLADVDADTLAHVTRSSLATLRTLEVTPEGPVGIVGFSMGASLGLWLSVRVPDDVVATAVFYGSQDIDFAEARSAYLGHFAEHDEYVDDDALVLLEAELRLLDKDVEFHRYPGTSHWFFERDRPEHDEPAAELAWERTLAFLRRHLRPEG
jgi:carboxymethylenebutenolidase